MPCRDGHDEIGDNGRWGLRKSAGMDGDTVAFGQLWNGLLWTFFGVFMLAAYTNPSRRRRGAS
ncbi:MAG: hypothetical protein U0165_17565 [Polyangiaceae bacterium]